MVVLGRSNSTHSPNSNPESMTWFITIFAECKMVVTYYNGYNGIVCLVLRNYFVLIVTCWFPDGTRSRRSRFRFPAFRRKRGQRS